MTVLRTSVRTVLAHKGRMLLSAVAVVLSVAFVSGTLVFTDTMNTTFDKLFASTAPHVTVAPDEDAAPPGDRPATLPAAAVGAAAKAPGAAGAEGAVADVPVTLVGDGNERLAAPGNAGVLAGSWTKNDERALEITSGRLPRGGSELVLDADTAAENGLKTGDEISVVALPGDFTATISGIASFRSSGPGTGVVRFDPATAQQRLLGESGVFTHVHVTARDGVSDTRLKAALATTLPGSPELLTADEAADREGGALSSSLDALTYAMLGFAGVAFLVGTFLIVNTFSMLVAQRTREIGLMRAIGSSRRQVNRSVLTEAVLLGLAGSVVGVVAGIGLAVLLMTFVNTSGVETSLGDLTVAWTTPAAGIGLGVVVTVVSAYVPARRAGKISPMAALRDDGSQAADGRTGRVRAVAGTVLSVVGLGALAATATTEETARAGALLGLGILLSLVGFVVVGPLLAGVVVRGFGGALLRWFGPVGRMAERNALRDPRRTGATGAALMIGLALVGCLSVAGSSMVASTATILDESVRGDLMVTPDSGQPIVPQAQRALERAEHIEHLTDYRQLGGKVDTGSGDPANTVIFGADPTFTKDLLAEAAAGDLDAAYTPGKAAVSETYAERHGLKVGDPLKVAFDGGRTGQITLAAIITDESNTDNEALYMGLTTVREYVDEKNLPLSVSLFAEAVDGEEQEAFVAFEKALAPYPQYTVRSTADFKETLREEIGQLLNIVYGLLALAIVVAVLGVVNTLALSVVERTREIGLMRALGVSRGQLRRMIRLESMVIALFGALLGLGLGLAWGAAAHQLLALQGLTTLDIPWPTILTVFVASAFVGLLAALVPAFRAARVNVLRAIAAGA
ncbi:FtsX-like permease family protein [Streptomyces sp. YS415]|uniref:ABC transporter permease n=1 Tax=Streptomyces sp. YS415 TaxID=2944806 RepID=UPI0020214F6F|nr:FtsX-like permease family protein [Streptomyces sp. YS415]MCL7429392.1 FtsX-like permease family protein [Streptomyces sp. YS415]